MGSRWDVERAILASDLPAPARLVALTLATYTDRGGTLVARQHSPSLAVLAGATGLHRRTVARQLATLETGGWVTRLSPGARTGYALRPQACGQPDGYPQEGDTQPTVGEADSPPPVGGEPTHIGTAPTQGGHTAHSGWAESHQKVGTGPHSPEGQLESSSRAREPAPPRGTQLVIHKTGATEAEATAVLRAITAEKRPRSLVGLVHRLARDGELPAWLDQVRTEQQRHQAPTCPQHRGQSADHCAPCRAEALADREDRP